MRIDNETPSTLSDYLDVLRRRKLVILQAVVLVPIAALIWSFREPPLYRASAGVLLNAQNLAANLENLPDPTQLDPTRLLNTQAQLARVPEVAERTVEASELEGWSVAGLLEASSVLAEADSDILTFSVTDGDPNLAILVATEYARQYTRYRVDLDTQALRTARKSVTQRLDNLRAAGGEGTAVYASLLDKEAQLETLESLQTARAVLVRPASDAARIQPQPMRNAVFGAALGLLLGLGLAALLEALDTRVRAPGAIAGRLDLRLLGRIPLPPPGLRRGNNLVTLQDPNGPDAEAFRILRTNLEMATMENDARTIMVTSAVEAEGKSTTVANLAVALARAGRHVVLVDLDLRRGSLHRFFGLPEGPGLTDVVLCTAQLGEVLTRVEISSPRSRGAWELRGSEGELEILRAGARSPSPGEFIAQQPLGPVLDYLKGHCDIVLIDGPPLLHVGDAVTLSSAVDALIVVARANVVRAAMLDDLDRILRASPASVLGLVVTGAEPNAGYGYFEYQRNHQTAAI